jgi:CHASE3 domain sensor protein
VSIDTEIASLKKRKEAAAQKRYLNDHQLKTAQVEFTKAQEVLQKEFGVSSVEEAKKMLADIEEQLQEEIARAEQALAAYEEKA